MTLHVATARYSYRGADRLDITRSGATRERRAGRPAPGEFLAPSDGLLWPRKERANEIVRRQADWTLGDDEARAEFAALDASYREGYLAEIRERYRTRRAEFTALLERERIVLVCFCPEREHCHREHAACVLVACGAVDDGEVPRG